jgi:hypothetical protein
MKKFSEEVLAVAIASEEEDGRIYMCFAENLAERYPDSARIFELCFVEHGLSPEPSVNAGSTGSLRPGVAWRAAVIWTARWMTLSGRPASISRTCTRNVLHVSGVRLP